MADPLKTPNFTTWLKGQKAAEDPVQLLERYRKDVLLPLRLSEADRKLLGAQRLQPIDRRFAELDQAYLKALRDATDKLWTGWTLAAATADSAAAKLRPPASKEKAGSGKGDEKKASRDSGKDTDAKGKDGKDTDAKAKEPKRWEVFTSKPQYGDEELKPLLPLPRAKDEDKELAPGLAPQGKLVLSPVSEQILKAAYPGAVFIGFVELGRHTRATQDTLRLVPCLPRGNSSPEVTRLSAVSRAPRLGGLLADIPTQMISLLYQGKGPQQGWKLDKGLWNGIDPAVVREAPHEAGCFLGFFLVLADPMAGMPLIDFRCDLNRFGNAKFCGTVPTDPDDLHGGAQSAWQNYQWLCRYPELMSPKNDQDLARALKGVPVRRAIVKQASKRMPVQYARAVVDALKLALGGR